MDQLTSELRETRTFTNYNDTSLKVFTEVDMRECSNFVTVLAEENYIKLREFYESLYRAKATRYELEVFYFCCCELDKSLACLFKTAIRIPLLTLYKRFE